MNSFVETLYLCNKQQQQRNIQMRCQNYCNEPENEKHKIKMTKNKEN